MKGESSLEAIHEKTGFKVSQIRSWVYHSSKDRDSWLEEKKVFQNQVVRAMVKDTKEKCLELIASTLDVVETRIKHLKADAARGEGLKITEVRALVSALKDLHTISQLESGDPTAVIANAKMTHKEIMEKLKKADPLITYDEEDESDSSKQTH